MPESYFIYRLRLTPRFRAESNWTEETPQILSAHFNHLKKHCDSGKVLLAGRTALDISDSNNQGICIFKAASLEDAQTFMDSDPAIANSVMVAELFPFSLAMLNKTF